MTGSDSHGSTSDGGQIPKREELELRRTELRHNTTVTIIVALLSALLGSAGTALIQSATNKEIEQKKNEGQLVLKMIETGDSKKSAKNLLFLVEAGLIRDPDGKIERLAKDPNTVPVLPSARGENGGGGGNGGAGHGTGTGKRGDGNANTHGDSAAKTGPGSAR